MPFSARVYDQEEDGAELPRSPTRLTASMSVVVPQPHYVMVHNLSSEGLLVESCHPLEVGTEIVFDIEGLGRHAARVTWHGGAFFDCRFTTPLPAALVRSKLTSEKVVWGKFGDAPHTAAPLARDVFPAALFPQEEPESSEPRERLSLRARLVIIVGGAAIGWGVPIALACALLR